jgi:hypothetical protein
MGLKNAGRYYTGRIVRPDGKIVARVLIYKPNIRVHFLNPQNA